MRQRYRYNLFPLPQKSETNKTFGSAGRKEAGWLPRSVGTRVWGNMGVSTSSPLVAQDTFFFFSYPDVLDDGTNFGNYEEEALRLGISNWQSAFRETFPPIQ